MQKEVSRSISTFLTSAAIVLCVALAAYAQTVQRPISDFLSAQTTTTPWNEPETGNQINVDYAGLRNATFGLGLGTTTSGRVTERTLKDGRASVSVTLHTTNAHTVGFFPGGIRVFGHGTAEVQGGATASLASSTLQVDFINTAPGAPLPNLTNLVFFPVAGQELVRIQFVANADGFLRAAFGVAEGTPGKARTTQVGLYNNPGHPLTGDVFPAERVSFWATGN